jgi:hypothetical protein
MSSRRGNAMLEVALLVPVLITLLVGMVEIGRITFIYYTLRKIVYSTALYVATQQGVNFCSDADATVAAAKNFALTGATEDNAGQPVLPGFTADQISIRLERVDLTGALGECECSVSGCDAAAGGRPPDFIVASIPSGYLVQPRIPLLRLEAIPLRPEVRVPYGGT